MRSTPEPLVPVKRGRVEWQDEPRSLAEREVERDLEARLVGRPLGEGGAVAGRKEGPPEREHCEAERGGAVAAETLRYPHRWSEQASERDGDHEADEWREDEEESPVPGRDGLGVECASTYPDRDRRRGADRGDVDQPDPPPSARVVPRERRQRKEERGRKPGARERCDTRACQQGVVEDRMHREPGSVGDRRHDDGPRCNPRERSRERDRADLGSGSESDLPMACAACKQSPPLAREPAAEADRRNDCEAKEERTRPAPDQRKTLRCDLASL